MELRIERVISFDSIFVLNFDGVTFVERIMCRCFMLQVGKDLMEFGCTTCCYVQ